MSHEMWVDGLAIGDRFMWCGRIVEIEKMTPAGLYKRGPSRRIWVKLGEDQLRLHYYDDEWVTVVNEATVDA